MMAVRRLILAILLQLLLLATSVKAFTNGATGRGVVVSKSCNSSPSPATRIIKSNSNVRSSSSSQLQERRWNFNEGQSPWGLKRNAEIWNGRVAQVRAVTCVACAGSVTR
jgi:hypothetical protein